MDNKHRILTDEAIASGLELVDLDSDHVLALVMKGQVIAKFSQTGVDIEQLKVEIDKQYKN